jgi:hypothetical protein
MNNKKLHVLKTVLGILGCLVSAVAIWLLVDFSMLSH